MQAQMFDAPKDTDVDAYGLLIRFAKGHRGVAFSPEEVTLAAVDAGVAFQDMRSWGPVFVKAYRDGYIKPSTQLFRRSMSNGSARPGWEGI